MSKTKTAFIARPRARQTTAHYTGHTWMVTYKGQLLEPFTPMSNECVESMLAARDIDIHSPDVHVEFARYVRQ